MKSSSLVVVALMPILCSIVTVDALSENMCKKKYKIGIMVPEIGPERSIRKSIRTAVSLEIQRLKQQEFMQVLESKELNIGAAYNDFMKQKVNVIIGGITPTHASQLRNITKLTTVLLTRDMSASSNSKKGKSILRIGSSEKDIFLDGLKAWYRITKPKNILVVTPPQSVWPGQRLVSSTVKILKQIGAERWTKLSINGGKSRDLFQVLDQAKSFNPDGIVYLAPPTHSSGLVTAAAVKIGNPLLYTAPIASRIPTYRSGSSTAKVYFSAQFWPKNGYFEPQIGNYLSIKSAVAVEILSALRCKEPDKWSLVEFDGITGNLKLKVDEDGYTVTSSTKLIEMDIMQQLREVSLQYN